MSGTISIAALGKAYRQYSAPSQRLLEWISLGAIRRHRDRWVLKGVNLSVRQGESVGIVGANGAGKSTLLKLITGTTKPTTGSMSVDGRVAALLELGIGFHPDVTGRGNVLMAGQLLGYTAQQVQDCMHEIERFAEIGDYLDMPLRTYSSGMHVRLAFSAATAIRPDILIVDEALSVGDAYFQHKSFARIREFKAAGTTLLFVSHSPAIVKSICDRAVLLVDGSIVRDGEPDAVLDYYHALVSSRTLRYDLGEQNGDPGRRSGDHRAKVVSVAFLVDERRVQVLRSGASAQLRIHASATEPIADLTVGFLIRDAFGNDVFGTNTYHLGRRKFDLARDEAFICEFSFPALALGVGQYSISIALHSDMTHVSGNYDWWDRALTFEVVPGAGVHSIGVAAMEVACAIHPMAANLVDTG